MKKLMRFSRRRCRVAGVLSLVLCLSLLLGACGTASSKVPTLIDPIELEENMVSVSYGEVYSLSFSEGTILPESTEIRFPVDGTLGSMEVIIGQTVKKGDVLFALDLENMQEQLDELTEQLDTAQSEAEMNITRLTLAYQQRKEEQSQLEAAGADYYTQELKYIDVWEAWMAVEHAEQTQELELRRLKNEVARLQEEINEYGQIKAPFDGVVTWISEAAVDGTYIGEDTPMMALSKPDELYVSTERMSERFLVKCDRIYAIIGDSEYELTPRENDKARDSVDTLNGLVLTSKYDFADNVKLDMDKVTNAMVLFRSNYRENVLCVPAEAVYADAINDNQYYVYRDENGARVRADVELGTLGDLMIEIVSGLEEGDVVYVEN